MKVPPTFDKNSSFFTSDNSKMDTWLRHTRLSRLRAHWWLVIVAYLGLFAVSLVANGLLGPRDRVTMPEVGRNGTHLSLHYRLTSPVGQTTVKMINPNPDVMPLDIVFLGFGTEGAIRPVPISFKRHFNSSPGILISVNFDRYQSRGLPQIKLSLNLDSNRAPTR